MFRWVDNSFVWVKLVIVCQINRAKGEKEGESTDGDAGMIGDARRGVILPG